MLSLRAWVWPLIFGLLVYFSINGYGSSSHGYNRQVAGYVMIAAATLLLSSSFAGRRFDLVRPVLLLAATLALSVAVSTWGAPSFYWSVNRIHLYYAALLLGIGLYLAHRGDGAEMIARYLAVVPVVHMIFLVYVIFWLIRIQSEQSVIAAQIPNFANIRHFAYHGFIAAAAATSLFTMTRKLELTAFALTAAALFGIVLLGARGAFVAWIVFVAFVLVFHDRRARLLLFCTVALVVAASATYALTETGLLKVTSLFHRVEMGVDSAFRIADRAAIWADAVRAIAERPWLGFGPEGFLGSNCCNSSMVQPHNFVLQFLLEFGLIGSVLIAATAWAMIRVCGGFMVVRKNLSSDPGLLAVCAVLVGFMVYAMIDGLLYHAIPLIHFALFAALFFATMTRLQPVRSPKWAR